MCDGLAGHWPVKDIARLCVFSDALVKRPLCLGAVLEGEQDLVVFVPIECFELYLRIKRVQDRAVVQVVMNGDAARVSNHNLVALWVQTNRLHRPERLATLEPLGQAFANRTVVQLVGQLRTTFRAVRRRQVEYIALIYCYLHYEHGINILGLFRKKETPVFRKIPRT